MAFKLGHTQEKQEREDAQKLRELEAEVQQRNIEKQAKLTKLNKKIKRNKILITLLISVLTLSLLTFGTYNTFFKKSISKEEIEYMIAVNSQSFDTSGVEGFLIDNVPNKIGEYLSNSEGIESYTLDQTSIHVNQIVPVDTQTAFVYFTCNIESKASDVRSKDQSGKEVVVPGEVYLEPYTFYVVLNRIDGAYSFGSDLGYSNDYTIVGNSDVISSQSFLMFEGVPLEDEATMLTKQTKVDRILSDIYSDKQVGSDFAGRLHLEENHPTYNGIIEFSSYTSEVNGFNAKCTYSVTTQGGLIVTKVAYMMIEQNGQSYKITKFI